MINAFPVRIGVIGLGQIAVKAHLPGYEKADGCQLTAVFSSREDHAKKIAIQYGIPTIYKDWKKLLASPQIDAVSICTPNFTHAPIALQALRQGKHVLVEKPMATSVKDARLMIAEAKKRKRVLMVHHNMRFDPAVRTAQKLIEKGTIGDVFAFACSLAHPGPRIWNPDAKWFFDIREAGGGTLMDLGAHMFDSLDFLLQNRPVSIHAIVPDVVAKDRGEFHCACLLKFKGGSVGTMTLSWADTDYHNRFYFFGPKGTLFLNLGMGEPLVLELRKTPGRILPPLAKDAFKPSIYQHFVDCIRLGKKPWVPGEDGLKALQVIEAGYESIRTGKDVSLFSTV